MKPAELFSNFKEGRLHPLYYFCGEDLYLQEQAIRYLEKQGGFEDHNDLYYEIYYGGTTPLITILESARSLPFLGSRKFLLVKEAEKIPAARHKELLTYCRKPSSRSVLVFSEKGKKCSIKGELLRAFKEHGFIQQIPQPNRSEVPSWIHHLAREQEKTITNDALALLQGLVGESVQDLSRAVEKLALFVGERKNITRGDVEATMSRLRVESVFELADHIGTGRRRSALTALNQLVESGEPPLYILSMITRHFRMILIAHALLEQGTSPEEVQEYLGIQTFIVRKLLPQAEKFSRTRLEGCFERLWKTDWSLKRRHASSKVLLEQLVLDLCE